jgi:hypothetical protein
MPYRKMTPEQVRDFLVALPARPGALATVRSDGRPHAAPVWFEVDEAGDLWFTTVEGSVKVRNLRPQASPGAARAGGGPTTTAGSTRTSVRSELAT